MATGSTPLADGASADRPVDTAILNLVAFKIGTNWLFLGRGLGIEETKLDSIRHQYKDYGLEEQAYRMLCTWRDAKGTKATVAVLTAKLEASGRTDVATEILKMPPESSHGNRYPDQLQELSEEAEWLQGLRNKLCAKYETYVMKGLPWMGNIRISLADYYVDLSVETDDSDNTGMPSNRSKGHSAIGASLLDGRNSSSEESESSDSSEESEYSESSEEAELEGANKVFQSAFSSHKRPLRVLVEGPPGYGKTTLSSKVCFDHAVSADYMKKFDLVLHFPLRRFEGSLEEMLCRAADLAESHERERFLGILNNPSTTNLLVLDGFDEVAQQHVKPILALLQGQRFDHVAVVVTSRPGYFTFERWEREENDGCAEFTHDWNRLWQSRITILGINKKMKALFIEKHLARFPKSIRIEVSSQLQQLKKNKIIQSKFLQCPLFLLMLILLATGVETGGIHNLRSPTDLYKRVFSFIIRRYCTKQKGHIVKAIDLFGVSESPQPFYVDLLCQFGEFALWALTEDKLSFSQEEILGSNPQRDLRILELGLLTQSVSMVGFVEKIVYEPVHKSLLEFSAAYALWMQCPDGERAVWAEKVVGLWRCEGYGRPLWLIMFEGLMRDRFAAFLDALSPYARCSLWEEWLRRSVSEIDLTESLFSSLTPFLPTHWGQGEEECFSRTQHDALLLHGIRQGTIKGVTLTAFLATPMPNDVVVDTAQFAGIKDTVVNVHRFNCRQLVFWGSDVFCGLATRIRSTTNFQTLSLHFWSDVSSQLRLLRSALTTGALKDIQIQITCGTEETAAVVALTELIEMEKLKALDLSSGTLLGSEELNGLLRAAANSSQLTTLILRGCSVDLCHLCGGVQKTWQFLSIEHCKMDFPPQTDQTLQANCLVLRCPDSPAVLRFLEVCRVTSLQCTLPLLAPIATLPLLPDHLTELNVILDKTAEHCRLPHLPNLTLLIFTIWDGPDSFAVRDFLLGSRNFLRLKGIEIWKADENKKLSVEIVKCVCDCLEQSIPVPKCQGRNTLRRSHSLQLQYFLMHYYNDDFLAPLGDMAAHLRNKSLSRLDIASEEPFPPDLVDLFSPAQGFRVETGVWGTRSEDSILRRMEYDTHYSFFHCYSIRHTD